MPIQEHMAATITPADLAAATPSLKWTAFKPSLGDFLIFLTLFWAFLAYPGSWMEFIGDADTGLHVRTGEYVLTHHWVPTQDLFSYSKPHETWYAFEWLSCTIYAALHGAFGLQGIVALSALMVVLLPFLWLRDSLLRGASPMIALPLIFVGYRAASIHFLARPHVFTLLIFSIAVAMIESDRRRNGRLLWLLVPLTILWTNLHGGFAILPVYLGILVVGSLAERNFDSAKRYALLTGLCLAASLVNPYGIRLHMHILRFLGSSWLANMVQEYASVTAYPGDVRVYCYFGLLGAGLLCCILLLKNRKFVEPLWIVVLGYAAFHSVRHIPIFAIATVPIIAVVATQVWRRCVDRLPRSGTASIVDSVFSSMAHQFGRVSVWSIAVLSLIFISDLPKEFPRDNFPVALLERNRALLAQSRLFTTDHWGDYIVYRYYPEQLVFVDGRSDYFGQAIGEDYLSVIEAEPNYRQVIARWRFDALLLPEKSKIALAIRSSPEWKATDHDNGTGAILFLRTP
jgi:hypothetical protein